MVDKNATSRSVLVGHALGWGMIAESAASGAEALDKLRLAAKGGQPCDIVVLDMLTPGIDGAEVVRQLRADPRLAQVRIIMLTTIDRAAATHAAHAAGVDRYFVKPVRKAQLFSGMRVALGLATEQSEATIAAGDEPAALAGLRVLLVDDNRLNQEVAGTLLRRLGCRVVVAGGGVEGVAAATAGAHDIVLMDCQMPHIDGYQATRRIRAWEAAQAASGRALRRCPIIALTANAMSGSKEICLAAGMDDFVSKPFNRATLQAVIERWLHPLSAPPPAQPATANVPNAESGLAFDAAALESLRDVGGDTLVEQVALCLCRDHAGQARPDAQRLCGRRWRRAGGDRPRTQVGQRPPRSDGLLGTGQFVGKARAGRRPAGCRPPNGKTGNGIRRRNRSPARGH